MVVEVNMGAFKENIQQQLRRKSRISAAFEDDTSVLWRCSAAGSGESLVVCVGRNVRFYL